MTVSGNDDEATVWVAARTRERGRSTAEGAGRHWDDEARPLVKSSSKALRRLERPRARLDVLCRRRLIARVLGTTTPGAYELAFEATPAGIVGDVVGGYMTHILKLDDVGARVKVSCRCSQRMHHLDPLKLRDAAWDGRPGKPREIGAALVAVDGSC